MTVNALGTLLWFYASSRPGQISEGISPRAIRFIARLHSARIAVYAAAVLLAPWLTIGSIALFDRGNHNIWPAESFPGAAVSRAGTDVTVVLPPPELRRL
jgi:hypothetical protein